jgi:hypothetical protein
MGREGGKLASSNKLKLREKRGGTELLCWRGSGSCCPLNELKKRKKRKEKKNVFVCF